MALRASLMLPALAVFVAAVVAGRALGVVAAVVVLGAGVLLVGLGGRALSRAGRVSPGWYRDH